MIWESRTLQMLDFKGLFQKRGDDRPSDVMNAASGTKQKFLWVIHNC